tara:strand:+ start:2973 stop:3779 length:807 start_codon:yes stop_codon:yes gene_type:complete
MQFYEEHIERLNLSELIRLWSPQTLKAVIVWFLMRIRLAQVKPRISELNDDISERLIEIDQIPQHAQPELVSIMNQLEDHGFVDPLIESHLEGSRFDNLKMIGARVLVRHKSGGCMAIVMMYFGEESSSLKPVSIDTFIDTVTTVSTTNRRRDYNEAPGHSVTYYPGISFEDLIEIHQQAIANRGGGIHFIHHQDEMLTYAQGLVDRSIDHLVQRGYLVKTEPDEPDLPPLIDYESEKRTNTKAPNRLIQFLVFLFALLIGFIYAFYK